MVSIAQLAERRIVVPHVVGSSPTRHPVFEADFFHMVLVAELVSRRVTVNHREKSHMRVRIPSNTPSTPLVVASKSRGELIRILIRL